MIDKVAYPTVGRIVLFHDPEHVEPFAGLVAVAEANRYTIPHLAVFLHDGLRMVEGVKHKDCVKLARGEAYWDWMDYQKGQVAKTEALQAELNARSPKMAQGGGRVDRKVVGVHIQYGATPVVLGDLPQNLQDELGKIQSSTPNPVDGKR